MLTSRAHMALIDLDTGARLNSVHSVARELIAHDVAIDNFGFLEITEFGRKVARAQFRNSLIISDENIADLSYRVDPMANPATVDTFMTTPPPVIMSEPQPEIAPMEVIQKTAIEPTSDKYIMALRCAGVATGETGVEVPTSWVLAFLGAWISTTKS